MRAGTHGYGIHADLPVHRGRRLHGDQHDRPERDPRAEEDDGGQADALRVGHGPDRRCPTAVRCSLLSGGDRLPAVRRRVALPLPLGRRPVQPRRPRSAAGRRADVAAVDAVPIRASPPTSGGWSSARSWSSSSSWRRPSPTPGEKGSSNGGRHPHDGRARTPAVERDRLDLRIRPDGSVEVPEGADPHEARSTPSTRSSTTAGSTASGRCRSPPPAAGSS